jgi:hypothetical protein
MSRFRSSRRREPAISDELRKRATDNGVRPKALICQGSCSEFEPCICAEMWITGLNRLGAAAGRSEVAEAPGRPPFRGNRNRQHDDAQPDHRQPDEFEYQRVHGSPPETKRYNCRGRVERLLICGAGRDGSRHMVHAGLRSGVNGIVDARFSEPCRNKPARHMSVAYAWR